MARAQHAAHNTNSKIWDYSDIPGGDHERLKDPPTCLKMATTLQKPQAPTQISCAEMSFSMRWIPNDIQILPILSDICLLVGWFEGVNPPVFFVLALCCSLFGWSIYEVQYFGKEHGFLVTCHFQFWNYKRPGMITSHLCFEDVFALLIEEKFAWYLFDFSLQDV